MWGVARGGDNEDVAALGERHTLREGAEGLVCEVDGLRIPPLGPAVGEVALQLAGEAAGAAELSGCDPDFAAGEMGDAAGVIGVEMGDDDVANIARSDAEIAELRADLFVGVDRKLSGAAEEGMPGGLVAGFVDAGGLAGVDDDDAFMMLDEPGVDG